jgi:hypothetical protein
MTDGSLLVLVVIHQLRVAAWVVTRTVQMLVRARWPVEPVARRPQQVRAVMVMRVSAKAAQELSLLVADTVEAEAADGGAEAEAMLLSVWDNPVEAVARHLFTPWLRLSLLSRVEATLVKVHSFRLSG